MTDPMQEVERIRRQIDEAAAVLEKGQQPPEAVTSNPVLMELADLRRRVKRIEDRLGIVP